jgi:hypothetical protein
VSLSPLSRAEATPGTITAGGQQPRASKKGPVSHNPATAVRASFRPSALTTEAAIGASHHAVHPEHPSADPPNRSLMQYASVQATTSLGHVNLKGRAPVLRSAKTVAGVSWEHNPLSSGV